MQFAEGLTEQTSAATSLKRRERSPSPRPSKRRVPSYYSPQLYADAPPSLARGWSFDANGGGDDTAASSSERSSPGLDWLRRTQDLHLATPPLGGQHPLAGNGSETGAAMDANGDVGMDGDAVQAEGALPHEQHLASTSDLDSYHFAAGQLYHPVPVAPHHAPPLHQHLAGSPQAQQEQPPPPSRPPSATSTGVALAQSQLGAASFGLAGPIDWSQQPASVLAAEDSAMMMDDSSASARKQSGGTGGGGGGGGWKVTMGYRADCIKCLQRVPGHYSHVVPT